MSRLASHRRLARERTRALPLRTLCVAAALVLAGAGCRATPPQAPPSLSSEEVLRPSVWAEPEPEPEPAEAEAPAPLDAPPPAVESAPQAGPGEVLVYRAGEAVGAVPRHGATAAGLWVLDLGSHWVPSLFRSTPSLPNQYEAVFIELANGRFDESPEGRRASQDRYLEPHGIPPSVALLERRFRALRERPCVSGLDLRPIRLFGGAAWEDAEPPAVSGAVAAALQARLLCEEHLRRAPSGVLDDETRRALQEFERRSRIYARGSLQGETLEALRADPLEVERRALIRVLTERAVHDLAVIEDGSAFGAVPSRGASGLESVPDLIQRIQLRIVEAFGLQTVTGTERFYRRLAGAAEAAHHEVAIDALELPSYYSDDMDVWVEIDRGDLYYEFPFDESGRPLDLPIERGPTMTLFTREGDLVRPLVMYPTTIGGWRVRRQNGSVFWQYKESRVGVRAWRRIVSAPVWLPPASTPSETLVATFRRTSDGSEFHELNMNLVGPSFASAYGLVAAYHQAVGRGPEGEIELGRDDGMRTHGSSDYTSIWRTVSSGCHRLHNHLAMRLFNFVLMHRSHRRVGHRPASYRLRVSTPGFQDLIDVKRTGYEFALDRPLEVRVLHGRVRGELKRPLNKHIPAADDATAWPTILVTPSHMARPQGSD